MVQQGAPGAVAMEPDELAYLVNKKNDEVARLKKAMVFLGAMVVVVCLLVAVGMFTIRKVFPDVYKNNEETPPDILATCLMLGGFLAGVMVVALFYSYMRTTRKLVNDIASGQKTIEPCIVIRKLYCEHDNTYNVYITSVVRLSVAVTPQEFSAIAEGGKLNIEYSTFSRIYFGYTIG